MKAIIINLMLLLALSVATACASAVEPTLPATVPKPIMYIATWTPEIATATTAPTAAAIATKTPTSEILMPISAPTLDATVVVTPTAELSTVIATPVITASKTVSPTMASPLPNTPTPPSSAILGVTSSELSVSEVRLSIDYFYSGEWGKDQISITAFVNADNSQRINQIVSNTPSVSPGKGQADIRLQLTAVGYFKSTELTICLYAPEAETPQFLCQNFQYTKIWNLHVPGRNGPSQTGPTPAPLPLDPGCYHGPCS